MNSAQTLTADSPLERYLIGITFLLSLIAGLFTAGQFTTDFGYYLFGGVSVGVLLFFGVYGYRLGADE